MLTAPLCSPARVPSTPRSNCCKPGGVNIRRTSSSDCRGEAMAMVPWCTTFRWMPTVPIARTSGVPGAPLRAYPRLGHHAAGVYRAGDTVQYKVYVRDQDNQRFIPAPRTGYRLQIIDPTDKVAHEVQEVSLSAFGAYHGEFTVPQNGAVGWYRFVLSAAFAKEDAESAEETDSPRTWEPMRVLISDFTPAPFRVTTDLHETTLVRPEDQVTGYDPGQTARRGPYGAAEMRLTASVQDVLWCRKTLRPTGLFLHHHPWAGYGYYGR